MQMKKLWTGLLFGLVAFCADAADKLPVYDTPQWHALPGMKELKADAEKGEAYAIRLLAVAIKESMALSEIPMDTIHSEWEFKSYRITPGTRKEFIASLRKYAEKGFYLAQRILAEELGKSEPDYFEYYRKAADQGDDVSQYNIGLAYINGEIRESNPEMTLKYWELSAAQGNRGALKDLGVYWKDGIGGKKDIKKGIRYLKLAADKGSAEAAFLLGEIYSEGRGVPIDITMAAEYFRKAAEKEPAVAAQNARTGLMHLKTAFYFLEKNDIKKCNEFFEIAASYGNPHAVITCIYNKFTDGDVKERIAALSTMTAMANKGNVEAQANLVWMLNDLKRHSEALTWYCRSLGNGDVKAYRHNPQRLTENLTEQQKNYLKGVFLRADYLDETEMQYIGLILCHLVFKERADLIEKYYNILLEKNYPRIVYIHNVALLKESKELTKEQKDALIAKIKKNKEILEYYAARGDNDAAFILNDITIPESMLK